MLNVTDMVLGLLVMLAIGGLVNFIAARRPQKPNLSAVEAANRWAKAEPTRTEKSAPRGR